VRLRLRQASIGVIDANPSSTAGVIVIRVGVALVSESNNYGAKIMQYSIVTSEVRCHKIHPKLSIQITITNNNLIVDKGVRTGRKRSAIASDAEVGVALFTRSGRHGVAIDSD